MKNVLRNSVLFVALLATTLNAALVFEQDSLSFEAQSTERELIAHFPFTNDGDEPVHITKVTSTCGCTAALPDKEIYAPGEVGSIKATFTFGERSGEQSKDIHVTTNAGTHKLTLNVNIAKALSLNPKLLKWEIGAAAETKRIVVSILDPKQMQFAGFDAVADGFSIKQVKSDQDGQVWLDITPIDTTERTLQKFPVFVKLSDEVTTSEKVFLLIR